MHIRKNTHTLNGLFSKLNTTQEFELRGESQIMTLDGKIEDSVVGANLDRPKDLITSIDQAIELRDSASMQSAIDSLKDGNLKSVSIEFENRQMEVSRDSKKEDVFHVDNRGLDFAHNGIDFSTRTGQTKLTLSSQSFEGLGGNITQTVVSHPRSGPESEGFIIAEKLEISERFR